MAADDTEKPPQDAFALIGNEIRAEILRTLAGPEDEGPWKELAFNELHSRVDPGMDSAQFNYHLQKLVGQYVRSTDAGYQISPAGVKLYRAIVAGTFTRDETIEPFDAGFDCHFCGARVEGSYQDDQFQVRCPECGHFYASNLVPPSLVDQGDDVLNRVDRIVRNEMRIAANRVCPNCVNSLDADIIPATESAFESADDIEVLARVTCDHCGATRFMTIGTRLLSESSLHAFAHDHGMDLNEIPVWELEFASTDRNLTIRSRDPWELVFSLTLDDETIEYVIDGELEVIKQTLTTK